MVVRQITVMRRIVLLSAVLGVAIAIPTFAQDNQLPATLGTACPSGPLPERGGVSLETTDRLELIARGLEAAESAKALLLEPEILRAARWCLEDDAVARAKAGRDHWRNISLGQSDALVDRLTNSKGTQSIYLIRVAKGAAVTSTDTGLRVTSNYAVIVDEQNELVIAGYFVGRPSMEELLAHLAVRGRITKADGKTTLSVAK